MANTASSAQDDERRVLVVADDEEDGALSKVLESLHHSGWRTSGASTGRLGLESLHATPAQVVVAGSRLPGMTGLDFLGAVKERFPDVQRVLITGGGDRRVLEDAVERGELLRLLPRPWDDAQLRLTIASAFAEFEVRRKLLDSTRAGGPGLLPPLGASESNRQGVGPPDEDAWMQAFDAIDRPIAILSSGLRVLRANRAYVSLASVSPSQIGGRFCHELLFHRAGPCDECALKRGDVSGRPTEVIHGERCFSLCSFRIGGPADGRTVCVYRETTAERQSVRTTVQMEKQLAIGRLAATLAHEINNPLGAILAFSQLMQRDSGRSTEDLEALLDIEHAAVRCKNTVSALLKLSRGGAGRGWATFDVNEAVLDAALLFRLHLGEREGVDFGTDLCPLPLRIRGDAGQLQQVFVALLTNSLRTFDKRGGRIVLTTRRASADAVVTIEDDGQTVLPEGLPRGIDRSCLSESERAATGMGFAAVWAIAATHGGSIEASPRAEQGTRYTLRLPLLSRATPRAA